MSLDQTQLLPLEQNGLELLRSWFSWGLLMRFSLQVTSFAFLSLWTTRPPSILDKSSAAFPPVVMGIDLLVSLQMARSFGSLRVLRENNMCTQCFMCSLPEEHMRHAMFLCVFQKPFQVSSILIWHVCCRFELQLAIWHFARNPRMIDAAAIEKMKTGVILVARNVCYNEVSWEVANDVKATHKVRKYIKEYSVLSNLTRN